MGFESGPDLRTSDVGIDIMKAELPPGETIRSFISVLSDELTTQERLNLATNLDDVASATQILFKYWTIKEAYTKAIGVGLNFDFSRIEYIPATGPPEVGRIIVDGVALQGWEFRGFTWEDGPSPFVGVAAWHHGGNTTTISWVTLGDQAADWIEPIDIRELVSRGRPLEK